MSVTLFAGTVRHHRGGSPRGEPSIPGKRADLIHLDEGSRSISEDLRVRDEEVIAHELNLLTERLRELRPAFPVAFSHAVFDRDHGVLLDPALKHRDPLFSGEGLALLREGVEVLFRVIELGARAVETDRDIVARTEAGLLNRFTTISSIASSWLERAGAKPPSSPTAVLMPRLFRIDFRAWNVSAP